MTWARWAAAACVPAVVVITAVPIGRAHRSYAVTMPVARFHRVATAYGTARFDPRVEARREVLWIGQGTSYHEIPAFRRYRPGIPAFLYKEALFADSNAKFSTSATSPAYTGGVSYFSANRSHPGWFLRDRTGNRLRNASYSTYWAMDLGDGGYQRAWVANAISEAHRYRWSGVFADDLSCWPYNVTGVPAAYPTPAAWQRAVRSFLSRVGARLHAAGLELISNSSACAAYPSALRGFVASEDGVLEEGWMRSSTDPRGPLATARSGVWRAQLNELTTVDGAHKYYLAELPASTSDTAAIRYGLATQLLGAGGHSSFDVSGAPNAYTRPFWLGDYRNAIRLGRPSGPYDRQPNGVYRRDFAHGAVLVNPTSATVRVGLGGRYTGSGLSNTRTATMKPTSGLILIRASRAG